MSVLGAVVAEAGRRFGDRPALVDPNGRPLSYVDLDRRSDAVAAGLVRRGVGEGDVVVLRLPSTSSYVIAYVAAAKVGAVTAGINPRLADPEQEALVELAQPTLVLSDPAELVEDDNAPPPLPEDPDRPVALVFTSGTTGLPKGAVFCDKQLAAVRRIDTGDAWDGGGPMLASTQFAHVGFMTKLPWYLATGAAQLLLDRWRAGDALRLVSEHRMPSIGGVAPQIALMLRAPESFELDFSSVKTIIVGGGPSPPALVHAARERFGAAYSIRYSSTESGGCGTGTAFDADDDEALHTVGKPRGGIEVRIDAGEVLLRSPTVMSGYWRDPEATAATLVDGGWLRTGDMGEIDERGNLRLVGRKKEMYIRGGYNVYPAEVEGVLLDHPGVADVAVVPRPDEVMGELGVAVVVPADPASPPTLADLRAHAERRLAKYKLPDDLQVVDDLPLTPMQKLDRRALQAKLVR
ncbi:MAG: class I adenylate-forming enzyme family protein [Actinomycetota bacterium]